MEKTKRIRMSTRKLVLTALFIAIGLVLPSIFHLFGAGTVFLPMHLPVLFCGFICGAPYGALCGLVLPLLSSLLTGMPPLFPTAPAIALELCAYGLFSGLFFRKIGWNIYPSLVVAMLCGRAISGLANALFMGMAGREYGVETFLITAFVTGLPGIVIQVIAVPAMVLLLIKAGVIRQTDAMPNTAGIGRDGDDR